MQIHVSRSMQTSDKEFTINVSEYDLSTPKFVPFIKETVKKYKINPAKKYFGSC